MLRVSKLTDYGSVLLTYMARHPDRTFSAASLAQAVYLPPATVSKLLKILNKNGLVHSARGKYGGYQLARPAHEITLTQILSALEGPIALTECSVKKDLCRIEGHCDIRDQWQSINRVIIDNLAHITLEELLPQGASAQPLPLTG